MKNIYILIDIHYRQIQLYIFEFILNGFIFIFNDFIFIFNGFYIHIQWFLYFQRDYKNGMDPWYPREGWDSYDPMLLSEGAFAAGMIFSFLKLVHIFSINPYLGPLQVSLGRMILDILKFFFVYMLVLFAFGCGKYNFIKTFHVKIHHQS